MTTLEEFDSLPKPTLVQERIETLVTSGIGYTLKLNEGDTDGYNLRLYGKREVFAMMGMRPKTWEDNGADLQEHLGGIDAVTAYNSGNLDKAVEIVNNINISEGLASEDREFNKLTIN